MKRNWCSHPSDGKTSAYNAGDPGSISGSGRFPGEGNGNPLQYSCLENPMDRGTWWATVHGVAKSRTRLSNFTFTFTFHFSLSCIGEGNGNPFQCSCLENPRGGGAWWAAVYGVAQSWTRLKQLSSSSSSRSDLAAAVAAGNDLDSNYHWLQKTLYKR